MTDGSHVQWDFVSNVTDLHHYVSAYEFIHWDYIKLKQSTMCSEKSSTLSVKEVTNIRDYSRRRNVLEVCVVRSLFRWGALRRCSSTSTRCQRWGRQDWVQQLDECWARTSCLTFCSWPSHRRRAEHICWCSPRHCRRSCLPPCCWSVCCQPDPATSTLHSTARSIELRDAVPIVNIVSMYDRLTHSWTVLNYIKRLRQSDWHNENKPVKK